MARATRVASPAIPLIDLMPQAEVERRARAALVRTWAWGVVGAMAVVLVAVGATWWLHFSASQRLVAEQAATSRLLDELGSMSAVSKALTATDELESFRASAMASDFSWVELTTQITDVLPDGVVLAGFGLYPGGVPQDKAPEEQVGLQGSLLLRSATPLDVAAAVRSLRGIDGVIYADVAGVTRQEDQDTVFYDYALAIFYDQTIYSGDYAADGEGDQ